MSTATIVLPARAVTPARRLYPEPEPAPYQRRYTHPYVKRYLRASNEELLAEASQWLPTALDRDAQPLVARYDPAFPLWRFGNSAAWWQTFLDDENAKHLESTGQRKYYGYLTRDWDTRSLWHPITVMVYREQVTADIYDGWHRAATASVLGKHTIAAIVCTRLLP